MLAGDLRRGRPNNTKPVEEERDMPQKEGRQDRVATKASANPSGKSEAGRAFQKCPKLRPVGLISQSLTRDVSGERQSHLK